MKPGRLLSPNETKYWLMDVSSPMNSVVVLRARGELGARDLRADSDFRLPAIALDEMNRPRWTEPRGGGVVEEQRAEDDMAWLRVAEKLTDVRVGTEGHPPWHAVIVREPQTTTLVFAAHHSVTDYRTGLWAAHCFVKGVSPGALAPACEDLLDPSSFSSEDAQELLEQWWLARAGARWHALGVERLAHFLPAPCATRLSAIRFDRKESDAFNAACEREGVTLNGAVAVALRDALGVMRVGHSIDMSRFIKPALPDGPGIAISHLSTDVPAGEFWDAARDVRAKLFERLMAGDAADEFLVLPRALLQTAQATEGTAAPIVITGGPTLKRRDHAYDGYVKQLVVGSPRAGGNVVILSHDEGRLELLSSCPASDAPLPLDRIAQCLRRAMESVPRAEHAD